MNFVGVDISKFKHDVHVLSDTGEELLPTFVFENTLSGFLSFTNKIQEVVGDKKYIVGLEATGIYGWNFMDFLKKKDIPCFQYNPYLIKEYGKKTTLRKTKTDKNDAKIIAKKLREDFEEKVLSSQNKDRSLLEMREYARYQSKLVKTQTTYKVEYTNLLDLIFPELSALGDIRYSQYILDVLKKYPSTQKIRRAKEKSLLSIMGTAYKLDAQLIKEMSQASVGQSSEALEFRLIETIGLLEILDGKIRKVEKKIKAALDTTPSPLKTIPGISYRLTSIIISEFGDIHNFSTPAQMTAFAGLEPSVNSSGTLNKEGKMVKRGSPHLRWALLLAAENIAWNSPYFNKYYQKKLNETKHFNKAMSHVARKLIRLIFHLLKNNETYVEQE